MADKNFQMIQRNKENNDWDNLFPITKASNILRNSGNNLQNEISTMNANDITLREEIIGTRALLDRMNVIEFVNKTGVGYFDVFEDKNGVDEANTTATYDSLNKSYKFGGSSQNLKLLPQTFNNFKNIELGLYPKIINRATVKNNVNNSTNVSIGVIDKNILIGDKLFANGISNQITSATANTVTVDKTSSLVNIGTSSHKSSYTAPPLYLSNGWIVVTIKSDGNGIIRFYVSKDGGVTWTQLCTANYSATSMYYSVNSYNTNIYLLACYDASPSLFFSKFDATTITDIDINTATYTQQIDSNQSSYSGASIGVSPSGKITASWTSKGSSGYNSMWSHNLHSAKSIDGGITWTKQDGTAGVDRVTSISTDNAHYQTPWTIYDKNDNPVLFCWYVYSPTRQINCYIWNGTAWQSKTIISDSSYSQDSQPCAILQKYGTNTGRIWCVWSGKDSDDDTYSQIRGAYSDNNGVNWSSVIKITTKYTATAYSQSYPVLAQDLNGRIYVMWRGGGVSGNYENVRMITWYEGTWSGIENITSSNIFYYNLAVCNNFYNFQKPLAVFYNNSSAYTSFYGKHVVNDGYTLTLQNSITLSAGQVVYVPDMFVKQSNVDMILKNIDDEKMVYEYKSVSNIANVDLLISGKDNELNAIAYGVS